VLCFSLDQNPYHGISTCEKQMSHWKEPCSSCCLETVSRRIVTALTTTYLDWRFVLWISYTFESSPRGIWTSFARIYGVFTCNVVLVCWMSRSIVLHDFFCSTIQMDVNCNVIPGNLIPTPSTCKRVVRVSQSIFLLSCCIWGLVHQFHDNIEV